ncbi:hypothetical protein M0802_006745 [Mischocyttarus mexicanus]|nr:hypothetical protein M0802_006745 [Mischocyttarus mexicanus]
MRELDTESPVVWPAWCYTGVTHDGKKLRKEDEEEEEKEEKKVEEKEEILLRDRDMFSVMDMDYAALDIRTKYI